MRAGRNLGHYYMVCYMVCIYADSSSTIDTLYCHYTWTVSSKPPIQRIIISTTLATSEQMDKLQMLITVLLSI